MWSDCIRMSTHVFVISGFLRVNFFACYTNKLCFIIVKGAQVEQSATLLIDKVITDCHSRKLTCFNSYFVFSGSYNYFCFFK